MGAGRLGGKGRLIRCLPVAVAVLVLAGGVGGAAASSHGALAAAPGTITTVAGGVGGPAKATGVVLGDCGVSVMGGSVYIADGAAVRKVNASDWLTTPAGTGVSLGPSGNGGLATRADFSTCGVTVDHWGNLVIAEQNQYRIAVVAAAAGTFYGQAMTAGHIYCVAGNGQRGLTGSGAVATAAALSGPQDVAVDRYGNLVIADSGFRRNALHMHGSRLQVVATTTGTFYGQPMTAGRIYTVAGYGQGLGYSGDGGPATKAALGETIGTVRVDRAGNLVFADSIVKRIRVVAVATGTFYGQAMTAGDIYTVAGIGTMGFSGDGGPAVSAQLDFPRGVAIDAAGNLVIADTDNNRIRVVAISSGTFYGRAMTAGDIYTVAGDGQYGFSGDGGPATGAELYWPEGVAVDYATGNLIIADYVNSRVRVVAESSGTYLKQPMTAGDIYTVAGGDSAALSGHSGPALQAQLWANYGIAVDGAGNLVITDFSDSRVRVVATTSGTFYGQPMTAGNVYSVAGVGSTGFSGDGGPAVSAGLNWPESVAVDATGNLVIADTYNSRVRVVAVRTGTFYGQAMTAGDIYTVAGDGTGGFSGDGGPAVSAEIYQPGDVAVDGAGNLLIADTDNNRVRVVAATTGTFYGRPMTAGDIYTVAGDGQYGFSGDGGPATSAEIDSPEGVAAGRSGNLIIADALNHRVRVVATRTGTFFGQPMTAGDIYTVAGDGTAGFAGDGGPATSAELYFPYGMAIDPVGNLLFADLVNNRVRVVAVKSGTFYGIPMTAGDIYTMAGDGTAGFAGDGGPATSAELSGPGFVAVDRTGNLLMSDNNRVRMVTR